VIGIQLVTLALVALGSVAVVLTQDVLRQAVLLGIYGLALVALFVVFQAPDVALSELVVSTIAYPLVIVAALAKVKRRARDK
jgi:energy-converting hydrogenase B subunit D